MNRQWVLFHLREAQEELQQTIEDIDTDASYGRPEFMVAMQHLYNHVNTAWNSQDVTDAQTAAHTHADYDRWGRYPEDLPTMAVQ